jgi:hypothetical protein
MTDMREDIEEHIASQNYAEAVGVLRAWAINNRSALSVSSAARSLRDHRALAGAIGAACDFSLSFEHSFSARAGLLHHGAAGWLIETLPGMIWAPGNVAACASALKKLAASEDGRNMIGHHGGVAALLNAWRGLKQPCLDIAETLVVLCAGHVDNISRFVREDGIELAMNIWVNPLDDNQEALVRATFVLVGECCICLPDAGKGGTLVPAVLKTLEIVTRDDQQNDEQGGRHCRRGRERRGAFIAAAAFNLLGNVGEASAREEIFTTDSNAGIDCSVPVSLSQNLVDGYEVLDGNNVVELALRTWNKWPQDRNVVSAITWALCALHRAKKIQIGPHHDPEKCLQISAKLRACEHSVGTARALLDLLSSRDLSSMNLSENQMRSDDPPFCEASIIVRSCDNARLPPHGGPRLDIEQSAVLAGQASIVSSVKRTRGRPRKHNPSMSKFSTEMINVPVEGTCIRGGIRTPSQSSKRTRTESPLDNSPRGIQDLVGE